MKIMKAKVVAQNFLLPYRPLIYLNRVYFDTVDQIEHNGPRSSQFKRTIHLFNCFLLCKSVHFFYLAFWPMSEVQRALHFDGLYAIVPKAKFDLMAAIAALMIAYFNWAVFLDADPKLNCQIKQILNVNSDKFSIRIRKFCCTFLMVGHILVHFTTGK